MIKVLYKHLESITGSQKNINIQNNNKQKIMYAQFVFSVKNFYF